MIVEGKRRQASGRKAITQLGSEESKHHPTGIPDGPNLMA
jgi:hypothetical protein